MSFPKMEQMSRSPASQSVWEPSFRMVDSRLENEIIPSLIEGAEILSMKFGYARG